MFIWRECAVYAGLTAKPDTPRLAMPKRPAIQLGGIVVAARNSFAKATLARSPLRLCFSNASSQPNHLSPATTNRSARASVASRTASPKWRTPAKSASGRWRANCRARAGLRCT